MIILSSRSCAPFPFGFWFLLPASCFLCLFLFQVWLFALASFSFAFWWGDCFLIPASSSFPRLKQVSNENPMSCLTSSINHPSIISVGTPSICKSTTTSARGSALRATPSILSRLGLATVLEPRSTRRSPAPLGRGGDSEGGKISWNWLSRTQLAMSVKSFCR